MLVLLAKGKRTRHLKKRVCTWVLSAELRGRLNVLTFLTIRIDTIGISNTLIGVRFLLITLQYVNARRTYHTPRSIVSTEIEMKTNGMVTNERRASVALHVESGGLRIYICHDWIEFNQSLIVDGSIHCLEFEKK